MKVRQLIELLSEFDPEMLVTANYENDLYFAVNDAMVSVEHDEMTGVTTEYVDLVLI